MRKEGKSDLDLKIDMALHFEEESISGSELTLVEGVLPEIIREVLNNQETEGS